MLLVKKMPSPVDIVYIRKPRKETGRELWLQQAVPIEPTIRNRVEPV